MLIIFNRIFEFIIDKVQFIFIRRCIYSYLTYIIHNSILWLWLLCNLLIIIFIYLSCLIIFYVVEENLMIFDWNLFFVWIVLFILTLIIHYIRFLCSFVIQLFFLEIFLIFLSADTELIFCIYFNYNLNIHLFYYK